MKKALIGLVFIIVILMSTGCKTTDFILEGIFSDIQGWDFTACVSGPAVCLEFIQDNSDKFFEAQ